MYAFLNIDQNPMHALMYDGSDGFQIFYERRQCIVRAWLLRCAKILVSVVGELNALTLTWALV